MGLFSPFVYRSKNGQKFWLHARQRGKQKLFYFSKEHEGALYNLPKGFEVMENPKTGLPMLKKKTTGFFGIKKAKSEKEKEPTAEE